MQLVSFERAVRPPRPSASIGAAGLGFEALEGVTQGARRLGALLGAGTRAGSIVDLNRALAVKLAAQDAGAPEAEANSLLPADALAFSRRLPDAERAARDVIRWVESAVERYDGPDLIAAGVVTPRRHVRLAAPVPRPGKIVGVACNYAPAGPHEALEEPVFFLEAPSALGGPEDELRLPASAEPVGFEGGLAVVIGRTAHAVSRDDALGCVAGYCVALDFRFGDASDPLARSRDGSTLVGPALVTRDEIGDPQDLGLRVLLSRRPLQTARTAAMLFPVAELVARVSARVTLEPGDLLLTGGLPCGPARLTRPLRDGDVVEVEIERIGKLATYVRAAASGT
ncbi:MAG TPA: fumarylacetoacetate hydrolase family protein [Myxococcota bacterium]|nr:fumarylacetoacetate hydrolase family protein [Myxococcota bacterium]